MFALIFGLVMMIVSYTITALITPKPTTPKPGTLEDFDYPQVSEGTPQPVVFGDCWTGDQFILWYGSLKTQAIRSSSGKK